MQFPQLNRRQFVVSTASVLTSVCIHPRSCLASDDPPSAANLVAGKNNQLIVRTASPVELETPAELLLANAVTPTELLFVRNNQDLDDGRTLEPLPLCGWKIALTGLVDRELNIDATELLQLEHVEQEMVLQCSGNSRSLYAQTAAVEGTPWQRQMGNVKFTGVPLQTLLESKKIHVDPSARFVTAEGRDKPAGAKQDFEHSLPLHDVLDRSMLALRLNDKPIPAIHGGPVRLVTPGFYGTMQIKWLSRLRFEASETRNHNHLPRYRVPLAPIHPGAKFDYTLDNSRPNWDMNVRSVVLAPLPQAMLQPGITMVRGVAFNDGKAKIDSVLVSVDEGQTWRPAKLERPASLYAWTRFEYETRFGRGGHSIWCRAIDALGRTQPLDGGIHWNPSGYEWNGVEKIDVTVI